MKKFFVKNITVDPLTNHYVGLNNVPDPWPPDAQFDLLGSDSNGVRYNSRIDIQQDEGLRNLIELDQVRVVDQGKLLSKSGSLECIESASYREAKLRGHSLGTQTVTQGDLTADQVLVDPHAPVLILEDGLSLSGIQLTRDGVDITSNADGVTFLLRSNGTASLVQEDLGIPAHCRLEGALPISSALVSVCYQGNSQRWGGYV